MGEVCSRSDFKVGSGICIRERIPCSWLAQPRLKCSVHSACRVHTRAISDTWNWCDALCTHRPTGGAAHFQFSCLCNTPILIPRRCQIQPNRSAIARNGNWVTATANQRAVYIDIYRYVYFLFYFFLPTAFDCTSFGFILYIILLHKYQILFITTYP